MRDWDPSNINYVFDTDQMCTLFTRLDARSLAAAACVSHRWHCLTYETDHAFVRFIEGESNADRMEEALIDVRSRILEASFFPDVIVVFYPADWVLARCLYEKKYPEQTRVIGYPYDDIGGCTFEVVREGSDRPLASWVVTQGSTVFAIAARLPLLYSDKWGYKVCFLVDKIHIFSLPNYN